VLSGTEGDEKKWEQEDTEKRWRSWKRALDGAFHGNMIRQREAHGTPLLLQFRSRPAGGGCVENCRELLGSCQSRFDRQQAGQGQNRQGQKHRAGVPAPHGQRSWRNHPVGTWDSFSTVQRMSAAIRAQTVAFTSWLWGVSIRSAATPATKIRRNGMEARRNPAPA
jgi:hypothetical protein